MSLLTKGVDEIDGFGEMMGHQGRLAEGGLGGGDWRWGCRLSGEGFPKPAWDPSKWNRPKQAPGRGEKWDYGKVWVWWDEDERARWGEI